MRKKRRFNNKKKPAWALLIAVMSLVALGLLIVFDASIIEAYTQFSDKFHFVKLQAMWAGIGLIGLAVAAFTPLSLFKENAKYIFAATVLLLVLVLIPGIGSKLQGARRWINIGGIGLQPSELAKLALVIYLPSWLIKHQKLDSFLSIMGGVLLLIMLEPDLGTAITLTGISFVIYYISGANMKHLLTILVAGLLLGSLLIVASPYRRNRLETFINPTKDPLGTSYHIRQVLIALGSGGLSGTGIGRSRQKYQYLPEATTDSIFAVIAEEVGFLGATLVLIAYGFLYIKSIQVTLEITDPYAQLVAAGIVGWFSVQTIMNLAAMVALVPLTGIPLPFISYGGSSLVTALTGTGLLLNTSRYRK